MSSVSAPEPGTLIDGKYRVERVLGKGGMGVVLEATHASLGKRVALKLLRLESGDDHARERFAREARVAAQLPDEHIAVVTDFGSTGDGEPYLVMELLIGNDLQQELGTRGPLPVAEAVDLVLQACEGVADAHAVGLVHRDIKPANLFLTRRRDGSPCVKVLDFGLSKAMKDPKADLTSTGAIFGTPQYMSPEQIRSAKYVDARTDQHALAMILYELLTGTPPYRAESVTGLYVVISTAAPPPMGSLRPGVPPGLEAVILRALTKDPNGRFPDLAAMGAAIAPFGGPDAAMSAWRMAKALGHDVPRPPAPSMPMMPVVPVAPVAPVAPIAPAPFTTTIPIARPVAAPAPPPRPLVETQSALASNPAQAASRRSRVAIAVGASLVAILGAAVMVQRAAPRSASNEAPASTVSASAEPGVAPSAPSAAPPPAPVITATATASAAEPAAEAPAASASAKGVRPRPGKLPKKPVDSASDVFGTRNK